MLLNSDDKFSFYCFAQRRETIPRDSRREKSFLINAWQWSKFLFISCWLHRLKVETQDNFSSSVFSLSIYTIKGKSDIFSSSWVFPQVFLATHCSKNSILSRRLASYSFDSRKLLKDRDLRHCISVFLHFKWKEKLSRNSAHLSELSQHHPPLFITMICLADFNLIRS